MRALTTSRVARHTPSRHVPAMHFRDYIILDLLYYNNNTVFFIIHISVYAVLYIDEDISVDCVAV